MTIDEEEPCCGEPNPFLTVNGEYVCLNCATCIGLEMVNTERRSYTAKEIDERRRTEPFWRKVGSRTIIPKMLNSDGKGKNLSVKKITLFRRLSKIQKSLISSKERNYWEAIPKMYNLASEVGVPDHIVKTAWKIYSHVTSKKMTMGRSIEAFTSMSLYAAIRIHRFPRTLDELIKDKPRMARNALNLIVRNVLPDLGYKYRPVSARLLVFRYGNELKIPVDLQRKAAKTWDNFKRAGGVTTGGKDPKGYAGALLYITVKDTKDKKTQCQVAQTCQITEVTLRTRAKQIKHVLGMDDDGKNSKKKTT